MKRTGRKVLQGCLSILMGVAMLVGMLPVTGRRAKAGQNANSNGGPNITTEIRPAYGGEVTGWLLPDGRAELTAEPAPGYHFWYWRIILGVDETYAYYTQENPHTAMMSDGDIAQAWFVKDGEHPVRDITTDEYGKIEIRTVNPIGSAPPGEVVRLDPVPNEGYEVTGVKYATGNPWEAESFVWKDAAFYPGEEPYAEITMPDAPVYVYMTCRSTAPRKVTLISSEHGHIDLNHADGLYRPGEQVVATLVPDENYKAESIIGINVPADYQLVGNTVSFVMPASDVRLGALFAKNVSFGLLILPKYGGTVKASKNTDKSYTITATPNSGYTFRGWYGYNTETESITKLISEDSEYKTAPILEDTYIIGVFHDEGTDVDVLELYESVHLPIVSGEQEENPVVLVLVDEEDLKKQSFTKTLKFDLSDGTKTYDLTIHKSIDENCVNIYAAYNRNTGLVAVAAIPRIGYCFDGWYDKETGEKLSEEFIYPFTMTKPTELELRVSRGHILSYGTDGHGTIKVSPRKPGYHTGDTVKVTAHPNEGYVLDYIGYNKTEAYRQTNEVYKLSGDTFVFEDADMITIAVFARQYKVTTSVNNPQAGKVSAGGAYKEGAEIELVAFPAEGYHFVHWIDEKNSVVCTTATFKHKVTADENLIAVFQHDGSTISAYSNCPDWGSVTGEGIYQYGDRVELCAIPEEGCEFVNWVEGGEVVSTDTTYSFIAESNRSLQAVFRCNRVKVSVSGSPADGGIITGAGEYDYNEEVTVKALAAEGFRFIYWTENGNVVSTSEEFRFPAERKRSLTAYFAKESDQTVFDVSNGNIKIENEVVYQNGNYYICTNPTITGKKSAHEVMVEITADKGKSVTVTIEDVSLSGEPPVLIDGDGDVTILVKGVNETSAKLHAYGAGIQKENTGLLTISGEGSLTSVGADLGGAGIGGGVGKPAENILITGKVTVVARGGFFSAGIGGGTAQSGGDSYGKNITISGEAKVTAYGNQEAAGIGGGNYGSAYGSDIHITGDAEVTAIGGYMAAGIGGAANSSNGNYPNGTNIRIDGNAKVYAEAGLHLGEDFYSTYESSAAGIGGGGSEGNGQNIYIGGSAEVIAKSNGAGAGIGGGQGFRYGMDGHGDGIKIVITDNARVVASAEGGSGAGIGGGSEGNGIDITISKNAQVTATGGNYAAGIGGGYSGTAKDVVISDQANVTAIGGVAAAGIGGGYDDYESHSGEWSITVKNTAVVSAVGGDGDEDHDAGVGIGDAKRNDLSEVMDDDFIGDIRIYKEGSTPEQIEAGTAERMKVVTVTFVSDDGKSILSTQEVTIGVPTRLLPNSEVKEGSVFAVWNTKEDGTGRSYVDRERVTITENLVLYARWHTHVYDCKVVEEKYLVSPADCTKEAVYCLSCGCGKKGTETFSYGKPLGHDYHTISGTEKEPTYSADGKEADKKCSRCGEVITGEKIPALHHTFDQEVADDRYLKAAADCTHAAVYFKSCKCGEKGTETFEFGKPLGHTFDQEVVEVKYLKSKADCVNAAIYYKSCKCGEKSTDEKDVFSYGEALGHDYKTVDGSAVAPTCTKAGKEADLKCSRCDEVISGKEIAATGHTFDQEVVDEKYLKSAADCTNAAVYYKSCKCGEKSTDEKDIFIYGEALGHDYKVVDGSAVAPTDTKDGKEADQKCSRCGDVIEGKVLHAKGHTFDQEVVDAKYLKSAADCITAAVYYKSCKCGEKSTDEKDIFTHGEPAGHKWKAATGYAPKTCEVCGLEEGQKVTYDPITNQVFVWTKGSKEPFVLTIKRSQDDVNCFLHYLNTLLDGAEIKVEARSGSTIITIPAETLELLSVGDHLITVMFDDWKADFTLSIAAPEATPTPTPTPVPVDASPSTGDTTPVVPMAVMMLATLAAGGFLFRRKRAVR